MRGIYHPRMSSATLIRTCLLVLLLAQAGCAQLPARQARAPSPCDAGEATYACQVERYQNVNTP